MNRPQIFQSEKKLHQLKMCSGQELKSQKSSSEIKSPTVNSSFLPSGRQSLDFNMQGDFEHSYQSSQFRFQPITSKFMNKDESKTIIQLQKQEQDNTIAEKCLSSYKEQHTKNRVYNFIAKLLPGTMIHNQIFLHDLSEKRFLEERYLMLQQERPELQKINYLIFYFIWQIIVSVVTILLLLLLPLQVGFQLQFLEISFKILIVIIVALDTLILIRKRILVEKNSKQHQSKLSESGKQFDYNTEFENQNYCTMISFIDPLYLLSYSIIQFGDNSIPFALILLIIQLLCGIKKLEQKLQLLSDYFSFDFSYYLFIYKILLLIHYCSCIWHCIGMIESDSWISSLDIRELDNFTRYCYSIYWSTATILSIGQANITIKTNAELIYSSFIMFISAWVLAYIMLYTFYSEKESHQMALQLKQRLTIMNQFFDSRKIPIMTQSKIRKYIKQSQRNETKKNLQQDIISEISSSLKEELLFEMRTEALKNCEILQRFTKSTLKALLQYMEYVQFQPFEIIDQSSLSFYIVETGQITVKEYGKTVKNLSSGDYFGQYSFFSGNVPKTQYQAIQFTSLFKLSQQDFLKVVKQHPTDYEMYMLIKDSLQFGNYQIANIQ